MSNRTMQGVFPILATPFFPDGRLDEEGLRQIVDFNLDAGVHGLGVALASEIFKLSENERDQVARIVVDRVAGRVPVVFNTGAPGTDLTIQYSRRAQELGVDALMILPPSFMPAGDAELLAYYRSISDAVTIPIFLQDVPNATIGAGLARQIVEECEQVQYIKVESVPITAKIAAMKQAVGDRLTIFGGAGGGYFIEEMRRGSVGTMPFCTQPEIFVRIWDSYRAGNEPAAMALFNTFLVPVARVAGQGNAIFFHVHKEILRHRGVIKSATVRGPAPFVEEQTQRELNALLHELYPEA